MNKKILIVLLVLLIVPLISIVAMKSLHTESNNKKEVTNIKENVNDDIEDQNISNNETEENNSDIVNEEENKAPELDFDEPKEDKQNNSKEEQTKSEQSSIKEPTKNSTETSTPETDNSKNESSENNTIATTCSETDKVFLDNLNNFKTINSSSRLFNTKEEAIAFGENALLYGYGYFYSNFPDVISGTNCNQTFYSMQLYIPAKLCDDNKMLYLPANVDLIDAVEYLKNNGYACS